MKSKPSSYRLLRFDSPSQVETAVKEGFGMVVSRQQVETHDPTRKSSKGLAKRWVTLFNDTRGGFRNEMAKEPIANRAVRLRALGRMLEEAEARGNLVMATKLLKQAARECGDTNTNRRATVEGEPTAPPHRWLWISFPHAFNVDPPLFNVKSCLTAGRDR